MIRALALSLLACACAPHTEPCPLWISPAIPDAMNFEVERAVERWREAGAVIDIVADRGKHRVESCAPKDAINLGSAWNYWEPDGWRHGPVCLVVPRLLDRELDCPGTWYRVALHEIGHHLGLHHLDDSRAIMYKYTSCEPRDLTPADVQAYRDMYP